MAQRDYVSRGRSATSRKKTSNRKRGGSSGVSKTMMALAVAVLVTFAGGLYFIAHNKSDDSPVLPRQSSKGNGLPPKPEERWRYIKELENRQIGVTSPTEPSAGGEIQSPGQLTDEQRQLLDQMQSDMKRQPTPLSEVPYNDQSQAPARTAPKSQMVIPAAPGGNTVTLQPSTPRAATPPVPSVRHAAPAASVQSPAASAPKAPVAEVRNRNRRSERAPKLRMPNQTTFGLKRQKPIKPTPRNPRLSLKRNQRLNLRPNRRKSSAGWCNAGRLKRRNRLNPFGQSWHLPV
nr:cell division protein FtsN [Dickeya lacustris]